MTLQLRQFHRTKLGLIVFGLAELAGAYGCANWAVDNGSLLLYLAALILLVGALQNCVKLVAMSVRRKHA